MTIRRNWSLALAVAICLAISAPAGAQNSTTEDSTQVLQAKPFREDWSESPRIEETCLTYDARYANGELLGVTAERLDAQVHFYAKASSCVEGAPCPARQKNYLVPGDVVLGAPADKGFRCVYYGTKAGKLLAGFLPVSNLKQIDEQTTLSPEFLEGTWHGGDDSLVFKRVGAKLTVHGDAIWDGGTTTLGGRNVHVGSVTGPVQFDGLMARVNEDGECDLVMNRRGPYLLVNDNNRCGGVNVRFSGIFVRATTEH